jgi:hypothetical protein
MASLLSVPVFFLSILSVRLNFSIHLNFKFSVLLNFLVRLFLLRFILISRPELITIPC